LGSGLFNGLWSIQIEKLFFCPARVTGCTQRQFFSITSHFSQPDPVTGFFFRRISYFDFLFLSMKSRALMVFVGTGFWLLRHMWTAPIGKRELYVLIPLVGCGHMSGL
jgi:hypothetical protein